MLSRRSRAGFSLAELLVALLLATLTLAAAFPLLSRSLHALQVVAARAETRAALWQASTLVASPLAAVDPARGELALLSDSAATFRAAVGFGVACHPPSGATIDITPDTLASGAVLASGLRGARIGDIALLLDEGASLTATDDAWVTFRITGISRPVDNCAGSPLLDATRDAGKAGTRLTLSGTPPPGAAALWRILRDARYRFYRASTGEWSLGWLDSSVTTGWSVVQPTAGPFLPWAAAAKGGVAFAWLDSTFAPVGSSAARVAAIRLTVRTNPSSAQRWKRSALGAALDSMQRLIAVRNRP